MGRAIDMEKNLERLEEEVRKLRDALNGMVDTVDSIKSSDKSNNKKSKAVNTNDITKKEKAEA